MPKGKIVCLILAIVMATAGTLLFVTNIAELDAPAIEAPTDDVNVYLDKPIDAESPSDVEDVRDNLFIAHKALLMKNGFYGVSEGATTSFGIAQAVLNTRYVVGEFGNKNTFKEMVTNGVVPNAYQVYAWGNNYIYRPHSKVNTLDNVSWKDSANKLAEDDFYNKFGHRFDKLTGYILNYDTVKSGKLENVDNGIYTFRYVLDTVDSTAYLRKEMVTNGNLSGYPTFSKAEIVVTMDSDWNVQTLTTDCKYTAKTMGISATCTEDITETFYDYEGDLPEKDFFEQFFDADYSDIDKEKGALDVLLDIFSPYLNGQDLQVALAANCGDFNLNALLSIAGLDISDLSKLSVSARVADAIDVAYEHGEGKIYLKYQDFQASTTIDGIMGVVGTITPLLGKGGLDVGGLLDGIDLDSLLENLTYEISEDGTSCVVSLPLTIGELNIDAKLFADIDGENYTFANAVINVGDVTLTIMPQEWTVAERRGDYPEITGLADLIQNGKVSLNAELALAFGDVDYDVKADVLVDLATLNIALNANLGDNGRVEAVIYDDVVYLKYGELKVKLDLANLDGIIALVEDLTGASPEMSMPELSIDGVLAILAGITATGFDNGSVVLNLSVAGVDCNLYLAPQDGDWQLDSITVDFEGISARVAPSENFSDVTEPVDADEYADVSELIDEFFYPILDFINGETYGVDLELRLNVNEKVYTVCASVAYDINKNISAVATIFDGEKLIIDAEIIYAKGTVYLTLNGAKVAFEVGGSDVDFAGVISQLLENEQVAEIIDSNETIHQIVNRIYELVDEIGEFDVANLLNVDFRDVIQGFAYNNGTISLSLDATALGFDGIAADITLAVDGGDLVVTIDNLRFANIGIALSATATNNVETIVIPDSADYVLNLSGRVEYNGIEIELQLSVDVINLDVWATAQISNQIVYLRYVDGVLYVKYGNVALQFATADIGNAINRIMELVGADAPSFDGVDLETIMSAVSVDLSDASLVVTVAFGDIVATIQPREGIADKLSTDGYFADGIALLDSVLTTVRAFMNADGVAVELTAYVTIDGKTYVAEINVQYNGGLYATLILRDSTNAPVVTAEVYFVDNVLYFDVNGIRQAIELDLASSNDFDADALQEMIDKVKDLIDEFDNETLNKIMDEVEALPDKFAAADFSQFISLFRFENGVLTLGVDLSQLDLGAFTLNLGLGQTLTIGVDGLQIGSAEVALDAKVISECEVVFAPSVDSYANELAITIGDYTIYVKLDLYHGEIIGQTELFGGVLAFKYVDGGVYLTYGGANVMLKLSEIDSLMSEIEKFVTLPEMNFEDVDLIETIKDLLDKIQFAMQSTNDGYSVTVDVEGVSVAVYFARIDDRISLQRVSVAIDELNIEVASVSGVEFVGVDTQGNFVSISELVSTFADSVYALIHAQGYSISVNGNVKLGNNTYSLNANVNTIGGNVYATFTLSVGMATMLDGQLWIVDNVLYIEIGDLRFSLELPESESNDELTIDDIKQTLQNILGYNAHLDDLVGLVLDLVDTQLEDVKFAELLNGLTFSNGKLSLGIDGAQFGLSQLELTLTASEYGATFALSNLAYKGIVANLSGNVSAYTGQITAPNGDFTTNLKIIIDQNNTLYANIDVMNMVIKLQLVSVNNGKTTKLDILYTLNDNIIKITNGQNLFVSADINNIVDIVKEIDKIVNEFAGMESDVGSNLSGIKDIDLKAIVNTLKLTADGSNAQISLKALGLDVSATFGGGALISIVVPLTDALTLTLKTTPDKADYATFPSDNSIYVRIDEVFNDYFYGASDNQRGAIDTLIHTNSWKFDFTADSEITVTNDDGTTDKYQIAAGSYLAFYYSVADADNFSLRAKLTVNKWESNKWKECIILDLAYIDGRIYVSYDSNSSNKNVLRATVSVDAIKECINLLPSLYKVVPQIEDLVNKLGDAMNEAQGSITLGNLASLFNSVTYSDDKVFTLSLNAGIVAGLGEIYLSAQQFGDQGLQLNQLTVSYNNISVNLGGIVVTASDCVVNDDGSKSYDYVSKYITSYLKDSGGFNAHMNLDSIRELLAGFVITADNADANGNRSFAIEGTIHANMIGAAKVDIQIYINVDIDKDNNVYLAVKIHRNSATGFAGGLAYDDEGGDSYLLLDGKQQLISLARNSIQKHKWCSKCRGWSCSNTILHTIYRSDKKVSDYEYYGKISYLVENLPLSEFSSDTATLVNYILELVNFSNTIEKPIKDAIGKENTNVYGIEDILKSYNYSYDVGKDQGTFAIGADLSPIDSALGALTVNILHKGDFDNVYYDDEGNFHDGNGSVALTQINGSATMIKVMEATFELNLVTATSGRAYNYAINHNYLW